MDALIAEIDARVCYFAYRAQLVHSMLVHAANHGALTGSALASIALLEELIHVPFIEVWHVVRVATEIGHAHQCPDSIPREAETTDRATQTTTTTTHATESRSTSTDHTADDATRDRQISSLQRAVKERTHEASAATAHLSRLHADLVESDGRLRDALTARDRTQLAAESAARMNKELAFELRETRAGAAADRDAAERADAQRASSLRQLDALKSTCTGLHTDLRITRREARLTCAVATHTEPLDFDEAAVILILTAVRLSAVCKAGGLRDLMRVACPIATARALRAAAAGARTTNANRDMLAARALAFMRTRAASARAALLMAMWEWAIDDGVCGDAAGLVSIGASCIGAHCDVPDAPSRDDIAATDAQLIARFVAARAT
jgi:hypothetical protein